MKWLIVFLTSLISVSSCSNKTTTENKSSLLWRITGNGIKQPSYLFGTYHTMPYYFLDSIPGFYKAFHSVEIYAAEKDPFSIPNETVLSNVKLPPDTTYKDLLSHTDLYFLDSVLIEHMDVSVYQMNLRPPHLTLILGHMLIQKAESKITSNEFLLDAPQGAGIDAYLWKLAQIDSLILVQLENQSDREKWGLSDMKAFGYFDGKLEDRAIELIGTIKAFESDSVEKMVQLRLDVRQAYYEQNLMKIEEALSKINELGKNVGYKFPPEYDDIRGKNRNIFWMEKIPQIIKTKSTFIAVGVAHLIGEDGLINLLQKKGYVVEPVLSE